MRNLLIRAIAATLIVGGFFCAGLFVFMAVGILMGA